MKKTLGIVLASALVLSVGTVSIFASSNGECSGQNRGENYMDADNNGACDNYQGDNDCINQDDMNYQSWSGNFVDENGDGVCDNYAEGNRQGCGENGGNGQGHHRYNHQKGYCNESDGEF